MRYKELFFRRFASCEDFRLPALISSLILFFATSNYGQGTDKSMLRININGLSVAYRQAGHGPALVLLHGFSIDSRVWKPQLDDLSRDFTVIAWDAPGAGQSADPPQPFTLIDWADCLAGLLDSIGVKKAHILGLSWGGILAQQFYQRHPRFVLSLILADSYAGWKGSLPAPIPQERLATCLSDASLPPGEFVPKYLPGMFSDFVSKNVLDELASIMAEFHPIGFGLMAITSENTDTRYLLPVIRVPTLLIWGEFDKRSPINVAHQFRDAIPASKLVIISNAGHVSNLEQPAQFNKIVRDFCKLLD